MTTKECSKCGEEKPVSDFHRKSSSPDGLVGQCKPCRKSYGAERYKRRRSEAIAWQRAYTERNADAVRSYNTSYMRRRRQEDELFRLKSNLRSLFHGATSRWPKKSSVWRLVGCSPEKLRDWLEMHFAEGMSWENRSEWHIDHIRPIASFEDPADPACWHWSNLQPLWADDNLKKSDKWT